MNEKMIILVLLPIVLPLVAAMAWSDAKRDAAIREEKKRQQAAERLTSEEVAAVRQMLGNEP